MTEHPHKNRTVGEVREEILRIIKPDKPEKIENFSLAFLKFRMDKTSPSEIIPSETVEEALFSLVQDRAISYNEERGVYQH